MNFFQFYIKFIIFYEKIMKNIEIIFNKVVVVFKFFNASLDNKLIVFYIFFYM